MKHLLKINADSEAVFKDHDVVYYAQNSGKSYVKKHYDNPFIKIFMSNSYHDTSIIPLIAKKYGDISGDITWSHNLGNKATIEDGVIRFLQHYEGSITVTATAGGKSASHTATIDCEEIPTSYTYSILNVSKPTANWDDTSATINFTYRVVENYPLKPSTTTDTPQTVTVNFPKYEHVFDYTTSNKYVDLGLSNGLKWAACSIGAQNENEHGLFFQWGDTEGYSGVADPDVKRTGTFDFESVEDTPWEVTQKGYQKVFDWGHYKYCEGSGTTLTKYCNSTSYGTVDDKLELDAEDDAAIQNLRSQTGHENARMPTSTEYLTLRNNTYCQWVGSDTDVVVKVINDDGTITTKTVKYPAGYFVYKVKDNAHKGKMNTADISALYDYNYHPAVEGKDAVGVEGEDGYEPAVEASPEKEADTHIFFPASGYANGTGVYDRGSNGNYWSRSLHPSNSNRGLCLYFSSGSINPQGSYYRCSGFCVRSVLENLS